MVGVLEQVSGAIEILERVVAELEPLTFDGERAVELADVLAALANACARQARRSWLDASMTHSPGVAKGIAALRTGWQPQPAYRLARPPPRSRRYVRSMRSRPPRRRSPVSCRPSRQRDHRRGRLKPPTVNRSS